MFRVKMQMEGGGKMFYKVAQNGGTFVTATFFDPETLEEFTRCVRDYEYADCSRDNDALYYMQIDEIARRAYLHHHGRILKGDTVRVIKGRKIPIGTEAEVAFIRPVKDKYGRWVADYLYFTDGRRTNVNNCILVSAM